MNKSLCPPQLSKLSDLKLYTYDLYILLHDSHVIKLIQCNFDCYGKCMLQSPLSNFVSGLKLKIRSTLKVYAAATFK